MVSTDMFSFFKKKPVADDQQPEHSHIPAEAEAMMEESEHDAEAALHDAAAGTIAEETVEESIEHYEEGEEAKPLT